MDRRSQKLIDFKLPVTWVITSAVCVIIAFVSVQFKLDAVVSSLSELKADSKARDISIITLLTSVQDLRGENKTQQTQIDRNIKDLDEIKTKVEELRRNKGITK